MRRHPHMRPWIPSSCLSKHSFKFTRRVSLLLQCDEKRVPALPSRFDYQPSAATPKQGVGLWRLHRFIHRPGALLRRHNNDTFTIHTLESSPNATMCWAHGSASRSSSAALSAERCLRILRINLISTRYVRSARAAPAIKPSITTCNGIDRSNGVVSNTLRVFEGQSFQVNRKNNEGIDRFEENTAQLHITAAI